MRCSNASSRPRRPPARRADECGRPDRRRARPIAARASPSILLPVSLEGARGSGRDGRRRRHDGPPPLPPQQGDRRFARRGRRGIDRGHARLRLVAVRAAAPSARSGLREHVGAGGRCRHSDAPLGSAHAPRDAARQEPAVLLLGVRAERHRPAHGARPARRRLRAPRASVHAASTAPPRRAI